MIGGFGVVGGFIANGFGSAPRSRAAATAFGAICCGCGGVAAGDMTTAGGVVACAGFPAGGVCVCGFCSVLSCACCWERRSEKDASCFEVVFCSSACARLISMTSCSKPALSETAVSLASLTALESEVTPRFASSTALESEASFSCTASPCLAASARSSAKEAAVRLAVAAADCVCIIRAESRSRSSATSSRSGS